MAKKKPAEAAPEQKPVEPQEAKNEIGQHEEAARSKGTDEYESFKKKTKGPWPRLVFTSLVGLFLLAGAVHLVNIFDEWREQEQARRAQAAQEKKEARASADRAVQRGEGLVLETQTRLGEMNVAVPADGWTPWIVFPPGKGATIETPHPDQVYIRANTRARPMRLDSLRFGAFGFVEWDSIMVASVNEPATVRFIFHPVHFK